MWVALHAYMISYYWSIVTFVVSCTVSEIQRLKGRKSPIHTYPTLIQRPRSGWPPSNFGMNLKSAETRIMGLRNRDRRSNHVDTVHECDRRTDRTMMTKTAQRIASRGKNAMQVDNRKLYLFLSTLSVRVRNCSMLIGSTLLIHNTTASEVSTYWYYIS